MKKLVTIVLLGLISVVYAYAVDNPGQGTCSVLSSGKCKDIGQDCTGGKSIKGVGGTCTQSQGDEWGCECV